MDLLVSILYAVYYLSANPVIVLTALIALSSIYMAGRAIYKKFSSKQKRSKRSRVTVVINNGSINIIYMRGYKKKQAPVSVRMNPNNRGTDIKPSNSDSIKSTFSTARSSDSQISSNNPTSHHKSKTSKPNSNHSCQNSFKITISLKEAPTDRLHRGDRSSSSTDRVYNSLDSEVENILNHNKENSCIINMPKDICAEKHSFRSPKSLAAKIWNAIRKIGKLCSSCNKENDEDMLLPEKVPCIPFHELHSTPPTSTSSTMPTLTAGRNNIRSPSFHNMDRPKLRAYVPRGHNDRPCRHSRCPIQLAQVRLPPLPNMARNETNNEVSYILLSRHQQCDECANPLANNIRDSPHSSQRCSHSRANQQPTARVILIQRPPPPTSAIQRPTTPPPVSVENHTTIIRPRPVIANEQSSPVTSCCIQTVKVIKQHSRLSVAPLVPSTNRYPSPAALAQNSLPGCSPGLTNYPVSYTPTPKCVRPCLIRLPTQSTQAQNTPPPPPPLPPRPSDSPSPSPPPLPPKPNVSLIRPSVPPQQKNQEEEE